MPEAPMGWISPASGGRYALTFERELPHAQGDVWTTVTAADHVGAWLSDAEIELRPAGRFRLRGQCHVEGEVLEVRAPDLFRWTWPHPDHPSSEVQISIAALPGSATRLTLVQTHLPERHVIGIASGWHTHLDALPAAVLGRRTPFDKRRAATHARRYAAAIPAGFGIRR